MTTELKKTSHKQILKATGILGGAQAVDILTRIGTMKIVAVLLGPTGVGIIGLYKATIDLIRSATGFGLEFSAVRDIAQAAGNNDATEAPRTISILRRWVLLTGLLGMMLTLIFCKPLSRYAFGKEQYAWGIAVLSAVLLLRAISGGQLAILQGLQKINMMAQAKVGGLVVGFFITVPLYWLLGIRAIVPVIFLSNVIILFFTWYYTRKIHIYPVKLSIKETFHTGLGMVRLGFFMMISSFITIGLLYIVRVYVSNKIGLEGVGIFQAAWSLSSLYLAAILQAMGADYFPRLSAVNHDNKQVVTLVNEQTEIAILLAGPIIVGMLSFINPVVMILYSYQFTAAISILHWMLAGTFLKILAWPIAFIMLAKGRGGIFICIEILSNTILICFVYFFWDLFGLEVTGIAYLFTYFCTTGIVFGVCRWLCDFFWSHQNLKLILVFAIIILLTFLNSRYSSGIKVYCIGGTLTLTAMTYSFYELRKLVDVKVILNKFLKRSSN